MVAFSGLSAVAIAMHPIHGITGSSKKIKARKSFQILAFTIGVKLVEPQGVEPWSSEDDYVRSTCLVDFDCRRGSGRQQPSPPLVAVVSTVARNNATAQFVHSTPLIQAR